MLTSDVILFQVFSKSIFLMHLCPYVLITALELNSKMLFCSFFLLHLSPNLNALIRDQASLAFQPPLFHDSLKSPIALEGSKTLNLPMIRPHHAALPAVTDSRTVSCFRVAEELLVSCTNSSVLTTAQLRDWAKL